MSGFKTHNHIRNYSKETNMYKRANGNQEISFYEQTAHIAAQRVLLFPAIRLATQSSFSAIIVSPEIKMNFILNSLRNDHRQKHDKKVFVQNCTAMII